MAVTKVKNKATKMKKIEEKLTSMKDKSILHTWERLGEFTQTFNENFYIVNAGLLKAGKSTLFNALFGKDEFFKTGDIRTTVTNQMVTKGDIVFVDTPGIDANDKDTEEAFKAYKVADILLFSHNISEGELQRPEVEFLLSLKALFPDSTDFWKRTIFVGTNADQMDPEKISSTQEKIEAQVEKELGQRPQKFFCVESLTYIKGIVENKTPLVEISGINKVLTYISSIKQSLLAQKRELFLKKLTKEKEHLISLLDRQTEKISKSMAKQNDGYQSMLAESKKINKVRETLLQIERSEIAALEKKKKDGIPVYNLPSVYLSGSTMSGYDYKSEFSAEREASSRFRENFYNKAYRKMESVANELRKIGRNLEMYATDNIYGWAHNEVSKALVKATEEMTKGLKDVEGMKIPKLNMNIDAKVDPSEKNNYDYLRGFYEYESADWFERANIDTNSMERYETGLFGRTKWVDYYSYDFYGAVRELNEALEYNVRTAVNDFKWVYGGIYDHYLNQLKNHFSKEINNTIHQIEEQAEKKENEASSMKKMLSRAEEETIRIRDLIRDIQNWEPELQ